MSPEVSPQQMIRPSAKVSWEHFRLLRGRDLGGKALLPGLLGAGTCHGVGVGAELLQAARVRGHGLLETFQHRGPSSQAEEALGCERKRAGVTEGRQGRTPWPGGPGSLRVGARPSPGLCPHLVWWAEWGPQDAWPPSTLKVQDLARSGKSGGSRESGGDTGVWVGAEGRKEARQHCLEAQVALRVGSASKGLSSGQEPIDQRWQGTRDG